jgi:hypothetical protein
MVSLLDATERVKKGLVSTMRLLRPSELRGFFLSQVPGEVLDDAARCILRAWKAAADHCTASYPWQEARDLFPYERRAKIDSGLKTRLARHEGVTVRSRLNGAENCWHAEVRLPRVAMTVSAVSRPSEMPRGADFRESLAQKAQVHLWERPEPPSEDTILYAVISHGPTGGSKLRRAPSFIHVGFPDADCEEYVDRFNLVDYLPAQTVEQMRREQPKLRREEEKKAE